MYTLVLLWLSLAAGSDLADDPRVLHDFATMLRDARYGYGAEHAAFLVRNSDGSVALVFWPDGFADSAQWIGALPPGAIAIVHTHPTWLPMPSRIDRCTSRATHLPVYVLTRGTIAKAVDGGVVVVRRSWVLP